MRPTPSKLLASAKVPALMISSQVNIRYLTGIPVDGAMLLVHNNRIILFEHALEIEMARASAPKGVTVRPLSTFWKTVKTLKRCGFEEDDVTVARLRRWKKECRKTKLVPVHHIVEAFRRSKDEDELKAIIHANKITEDILERIPKFLKKGITEAGLSWIIESESRQRGAKKMAFETIVAFGSHTSRPHHRPTDRRLKKGDLVQIDMGVVIDGYCSDRSAVYFTGKPTPQQKKVLAALEEAKQAAIDVIGPGVKCSEPDRIARKILRKYKLEKYFVHTLGHGVGLDIHEGVSLSERSKEVLLEHEVVTVEPGVYFPGKWGMRLEDMVIVE